MLSHIRRRRILIAALAGAAFAALGITVASSHASVPRPQRADRVHAPLVFPRLLPRDRRRDDDRARRQRPRQLTNTAPGRRQRRPRLGTEAATGSCSTATGPATSTCSRLNANGHDLRQLTRTGGFEFTPSASPDGKLLAFEHDAADFSSGASSSAALTAAASATSASSPPHRSPLAASTRAQTSPRTGARSRSSESSAIPWPRCSWSESTAVASSSSRRMP